MYFVILFSEIGQCCHPAQKNGLENKKKLATLGITRIIYGIFSKYSRPQHKLEAAHGLQTTEDRQIFLYNELLYKNSIEISKGILIKQFRGSLSKPRK